MHMNRRDSSGPPLSMGERLGKGTRPRSRLWRVDRCPGARQVWAEEVEQRLADAVQPSGAQHVDGDARLLGGVDAVGLLAVHVLQHQNSIGLLLAAADDGGQAHLADRLLQPDAADAEGIDAPLAEYRRI